MGYAKNSIEKTCSIFNWPQNRQKSLNFQKNDNFRILRFFSFELLQETLGFWQYLEVSVTIFEKLQKISTFFNDFIILTSQTSFDLTNSDEFKLARHCQSQNFSIFANWTFFSNLVTNSKLNKFFSMQFYSITHMKVALCFFS